MGNVSERTRSMAPRKFSSSRREADFAEEEAP
jgi:hypothetical protein